jgi:hypothetical protein
VIQSDPSERNLIDELGVAAGLKVSASKVKGLRERGLIPAYQVGPNLFRYDLEEVLEALRVPRVRLHAVPEVGAP